MAVQTRRGVLDVAGRSIAYSASGPGDGTIVFVHGFGSDRNVWSFNVPALTVGRTVYALDLPGHGDSQPGLDSGSLDELVAIVAGFVDGLGLSRVHLIGHSLGAAIALRLAVDRPALAVGLTLVAPAGIGASVDSQFLDDFLAMPSPEDAQRVLGRLVAKPSLISTDMATAVWHHNQQSGVAETLSAIADNAVRRDLADGLLRQTLLSLDVPVEVIWGREDAIIPATSADGLPDRIPVHRVDGAGHLVQMEKSPIVNRLMAAQAARLG
jgi:pyruvate dehydrogenase E2 component (dihydrolipoamide acetyltransferase)